MTLGSRLCRSPAGSGHPRPPKRNTSGRPATARAPPRSPGSTQGDGTRGDGTLALGARPYHSDEVSAAVLPRQALLEVVLADHGAQPAAEHDVGAVRLVPLPAGTGHWERAGHRPGAPHQHGGRGSLLRSPFFGEACLFPVGNSVRHRGRAHGTLGKQVPPALSSDRQLPRGSSCRGPGPSSTRTHAVLPAPCSRVPAGCGFAEHPCAREHRALPAQQGSTGHGRPGGATPGISTPPSFAPPQDPPTPQPCTPHLYTARPASTSIQSRAKSICRTKDDMRFTTVCATPRTTVGCFRMILPRRPRQPVPPAGRHLRGHGTCTPVIKA